MNGYQARLVQESTSTIDLRSLFSSDQLYHMDLTVQYALALGVGMHTHPLISRNANSSCVKSSVLMNVCYFYY